MNSIEFTMTGHSAMSGGQSCFGMPTSGRAFGVATSPRRAAIQGTTVSPIATGSAKGDLGLVPSYFRGTTAWRPPIC